MKLFDLIDLFIRDSTLAIFESRLSFLFILKKHYKLKLNLMKGGY
jgi:hypothetical protein